MDGAIKISNVCMQSIMSVPVNKETFDSIITQFLDAANRKPNTYSMDRAHALSKQVKILASDDESVTDDQKNAARKDLVNALIRGHENGAYGLADSALAYEAVTFYASGAFNKETAAV